ncbi:hypothetical protein D3C72_1465490 [compost metagenome]
MRGQVAEKTPDGAQRFLVIVHNHVGQPGDFSMHAPATEFFGIRTLADGHRGDFWAGNSEHCAFAHHGEIRQARIPARRTEARPEHCADPRRLAPPAVLLGILAATGHAARTHRILHALARRFAEENQRHAVAGGAFLHVGDLARIDPRGRRAFDRHVVGHHGDTARVDAAKAGDLAVGGGAVAILGAGGVGQHADLAERLRVEQTLQPLTGVEHAGIAARLEPGFAAHVQGGGATGVQLLFG